MPIQLPDLAVKSYKDILDETISSIPKYTDRWTNHNPSDPGITILELLAWITETTLYRSNRINKEAYVNFLRLVAGTSGPEAVNNLLNDPAVDISRKEILGLLKEIENGSEKPVTEMKAAALKFLSSRYRAVTEDDFMELAIESCYSSEAKVRRAIVRKVRNEEKIEIVIISDKPERYDDLIGIVSNYLAPRVLIGTIFEVVEPAYTKVNIGIRIICQSYSKSGKVRENVRSRVISHLDHLTGGPEKTGWPYGRPVTIYELTQIVEETEGVKLAESVKFDNDDTLKIKPIEGLIDPVVNVDVAEEK